MEVLGESPEIPEECPEVFGLEISPGESGALSVSCFTEWYGTGIRRGEKVLSNPLSGDEMVLQGLDKLSTFTLTGVR